MFKFLAKVAEKYAKAAGKVQLTELDFKSSASYTSGMATYKWYSLPGS